MRGLRLAALIGAVVCGACVRDHVRTAPRHEQPISEVRASVPHPVGHGRLELIDEARQRPVLVELWYPAPTGVAEQPRRYSLGKGQVADGAAFNTELPLPRPLVVLSHGAGGSPDNYGWLVEVLAGHGFVVAGIHHYGESRGYGAATVDPRAVLQVWRRPDDVRFALGELLTHEEWSSRLSDRLLLGVGHSAGAHTLVALAGAPYEMQRLGPYCTEVGTEVDRGCAYAKQFGPPPRQPESPERAPIRFRRLLLLDPAMGPSFSEQALATVRVPTHVIGTHPGDFLPYEPHAGHFATHLGQAWVTSLQGGPGHFVFLNQCELGISVFDIPLCSDEDSVNRARIHGHVAALSLEFFGAG